MLNRPDKILRISNLATATPTYETILTRSGLNHAVKYFNGSIYASSPSTVYRYVIIFKQKMLCSLVFYNLNFKIFYTK